MQTMLLLPAALPSLGCLTSASAQPGAEGMLLPLDALENIYSMDGIRSADHDKASSVRARKRHYSSPAVSASTNPSTALCGVG